MVAMDVDRYYGDNYDFTNRLLRFGAQTAYNNREAIGRYVRKKAREWVQRRPRAQASRARRNVSSKQVVQRSNNSTRTGVRSKSRFKRKRKRRTKVGKRLRKKVKQVLADEENSICGTHINLPRMTVERAEVDHLKSWTLFPHGKTSSGVSPGRKHSGDVHSWNKILHAASCMYNDKVATEFPDIGDAGNFSNSTLVVDVLYHKMKVWIKNNSNRTYYISLWKFTSKKTQFGDYNPLYMWERARNQESLTAPGALVEGFTFNTLDQTRLVQTEWPHTPRMYYQMRKFWDMQEIKIILEPGQVTEQTIMLPTGKMTGADYFVDGTYQDYHKGNVRMAMSYIVDPIQAKLNTEDPSVGEAGYFKDPNNTLQANPPEGGLILETKIHTKIKMPEQAGFELTTATSGAQELGYRMPKIFFEDYQSTLAVTSNRVLRRTDPVEPSVTDAVEL
jgi:hypothetical protein